MSIYREDKHCFSFVMDEFCKSKALNSTSNHFLYVTEI